MKPSASSSTWVGAPRGKRAALARALGRWSDRGGGRRPSLRRIAALRPFPCTRSDNVISLAPHVSGIRAELRRLVTDLCENCADIWRRPADQPGGTRPAGYWKRDRRGGSTAPATCSPGPLSPNGSENGKEGDRRLVRRRRDSLRDQRRRRPARSSGSALPRARVARRATPAAGPSGDGRGHGPAHSDPG